MNFLEKTYRGQTVLVVGASGYLGSLITQKLLGLGARVIGISRTGPPISHLNLESHQIDLETTNKPFHILAGRRIDNVFYLAGQTSHYVADRNPRKDWMASVSPLLDFLTFLQTSDSKPKIVFASTVTVYGLGQLLPIHETSVVSPVGIYDVHKLTCENYLSAFYQTHHIPYVSLRLANVYGFGLQKTKDDRGILNLMVKKALLGEPLKILGPGEWLRDYIHINDVAEAFLHAGSITKEEHLNRAYNICSGKSFVFKNVIEQIALKIQDLLSLNTTIDFDKNWTPASPIDIRSFKGEPTAFMSATLWKPKISFEEGLKQLILDIQAEN